LHPLDLDELSILLISRFTPPVRFAQSKVAFIALLPPKEIQDYEVQQFWRSLCQSRRSPPAHYAATPFDWLPEQLVLEQCLATFAHNRKSVPVTLNGFGAFHPALLHQCSQDSRTLTLQTDLMAHLETLLGIVDPVSKTRLLPT